MLIFTSKNLFLNDDLTSASAGAIPSADITEDLYIAKSQSCSYLIY